MNPTRLEEFRSQTQNWERYFSEQSCIPILQGSAAWRHLQAHSRNLRRRLREGPDVPARVAFFGATGVGKSKLFSSVLGQLVSESSFRRPFTRRPCYYLHRDWQVLQPQLDGEVVIHEQADWRQHLLVDTPDFDSIEANNLLVAERVSGEADAFVFITDALKYADASTWKYLGEIHHSGKEYLIVLNKVNSAVILESFLERFRDTIGREAGPDGILPTPIVVPEIPVDDQTLIRPEEPSLMAVRNALVEFGRNEGRTSRTRLLRMEAEQMFAEASQTLREVVRVRQVHEELQLLLQQRLREAQAHLESRLTLSLDAGMREAVYQRVLSRIEQLDVLRYPRYLLSLPARAVRHLLSGWWGRAADSAPESLEKGAEDPTSVETFQLLEAEVLRYMNQVRIDILAREPFAGLLSRERFRDLRLEHAELQQRYREEHARFRAWVAEHAQDTAAAITHENKAKFFLSQLLFNSVLITAQIHTGGLSLMELGLDSVVSPFMAKGIGMMISHEKVQSFEQTAKREHQKAMLRVMEEVQQRFSQFLSSSCQGLEELEQQLLSVVQFQEDLPYIVESFQAHTIGEREGGRSRPVESRS